LICAELCESGGRESRHRETRPRRPLTPKHGIRHTLRLSLRGRLWLELTPGRRRNRAIRRTIGDALESVGDTGLFEGNLVGSVRPLQHDDAFSAEVKGGPEQQTNHDGYTSH